MRHYAYFRSLFNNQGKSRASILSEASGALPKSLLFDRGGDGNVNSRLDRYQQPSHEALLYPSYRTAIIIYAVYFAFERITRLSFSRFLVRDDEA